MWCVVEVGMFVGFFMNDGGDMFDMSVHFVFCGGVPVCKVKSDRSETHFGVRRMCFWPRKI